jgi:hypothetical protein
VNCLIFLFKKDATGEIYVRQWLDSGESQQDFVPDMRVKIVGHVREFQEKVNCTFRFDLL